jgi:hypothetical protein
VQADVKEGKRSVETIAALDAPGKNKLLRIFIRSVACNPFESRFSCVSHTIRSYYYVSLPVFELKLCEATCKAWIDRLGATFRALSAPQAAEVRQKRGDENRRQTLVSWIIR